MESQLFWVSDMGQKNKNNRINSWACTVYACRGAPDIAAFPFTATRCAYKETLIDTRSASHGSNMATGAFDMRS